MICLRCAYCCHNYAVVIVNDPKIGIKENNLIALPGDGKPCPHLIGNCPGEYACEIHDKKWYKKTPCHAHTQIEHKNSPCRMGTYVMDKEKDKVK